MQIVLPGVTADRHASSIRLLTSRGLIRLRPVLADAINGGPVQVDTSVSRGQMAIEVDGVVISAPTVNTPEFVGEVAIAGQFGEDEAQELAAFLRYGALRAVTVESVTTG